MLLSLPYVSPLAEATTAEDVDAIFVTRSVDYGVGKSRKIAQVLKDAFRTFLASRGTDATVVCTTMADAVVLAVLYRLRRHHTLAVWDFLLPTSPRVRQVARWALRRVDRWFVIRRADGDVFERYVGATGCQFIPFPVTAREDVRKTARTHPEFIYAAGSAHRDWKTLVDAARRADVRLLISTNRPVPGVNGSGSIVVTPLATPEEGRRHVADAIAVCIPFDDTELPCGPLVVLDAMAAGKAVVTTDVNGSRDYVSDGINALVVPPHDPEALAQALLRVQEDVALRSALGAAGRASVLSLSPERVLADFARELRSGTGLPHS